VSRRARAAAAARRPSSFFLRRRRRRLDDRRRRHPQNALVLQAEDPTDLLVRRNGHDRGRHRGALAQALLIKATAVKARRDRVRMSWTQFSCTADAFVTTATNG
jgi:hypothetical protein